MSDTRTHFDARVHATCKRAAGVALLATLLAPTAVAQVGGAAQAGTGGSVGGGAEPREWERIDGVAIEIDGDMIPWSSVISLYQRAQGSRPVTKPSEQQELLADITRSLVNSQVRVQGGSELDLPPEQIDLILGRMLDEKRAPVGAIAYGEQLRSRGLDPLGEAQAGRQEIWAYAFENEILGRTGFGGLRPRVDRYIRPKELYAEYVMGGDRLGTPPKVALQVLDVSAAAAGGLEAAESQARGILAELRQGADFEELFDLNAARFRTERGRWGLVEANRLTDAELREFAMVAECDAVSEVLSYRDERGEPAGYRVARVLERIEGTPKPAFTDPQTQSALRLQLDRRRDEERLRRAEQERRSQSHIWLDRLLLGDPGRR